MTFERLMHHRRSLRYKDYDYRTVGAYLVTIVTANRENLFGEVIDGSVHLNRLGQMVQGSWEAIPDHFPAVELDEFVVMPNHFHGIVLIMDAPQAPPLTENAPKHNNNEPIGTQSGSLGAIVQYFKSVTSRRVNRIRAIPDGLVWQRNYHDRIIRNENELNQKREYIFNNPLQWSLDEENPANQK